MLSKRILATIAYYDCFDYPLTAFEVWKFLLTLEPDEPPTKVELSEVYQTLERERDKGSINVERGCYALPGRGALVATRIAREKVSVAKLRRARKLMRFLQWVPFVRCVSITGSLALKQAETASDWDFFVVLQAGHLWTGRLVFTAFLQLLGKRRHGKYVADRACLNYYIANSALGIAPKDLFAAHEYSTLIPLYGADTFRRFELANRWMATYRAQFLPTEVLPLWLLPPTGVFARRLQNLLETLLSHPAIEQWCKAWQARKIWRNPKSALPGSFIRADDTALVFLPSPQGPRIFSAFKDRLSRGFSAADIPGRVL